MKYLLLIFLLLPVLAVGATPYQGKYTKLPKRQDTGLGYDRVQVLLFSAYSCEECQSFKTQFEEWKSKHEANPKVVFERMPSTLVKDGKEQARAYYTAEEYKAEPSLHDELSAAIQSEELVLEHSPVASFLGSRLGVDESQVEATMDSLSVNAAVMYADDVSRRYQVNVVPVFIVNGRYGVSLKQAGNPKRLFKILDYLIGLELANYRYRAL